MEQGRVFLAIVLSFIVFFVWEMASNDKKAVKKTAPPQAVQETATDTPQAPAQALPAAPVPTPSAPVAAAPVAPPASTDPALQKRLITIRTPLYAATIDEHGGRIVSFKLSQFRERVELDSPNLDLLDGVAQSGALRVAMDSAAGGNVIPADATYRAPEDMVDLKLETARTIPFTWVGSNGVAVEKRFHFDPDTYVIGLDLVVHNRSGMHMKGPLSLSLVSKKPETTTYGFQGPALLINGNMEQVKIKSIRDKSTHTGNITWVALQSQYFMSSIIPDAGDASAMTLSETETQVENRFVTPAAEIPNGSQKTFKYLAFFGPKSTDILRSVGHQLDRAVNFGWFDFIAKPCLALMKFFYSVVPNYGVAIIVLTILIKILLWPLGQKSYKSMSQMKRMQPLMAEIREKHKNDKKRMNEELMMLYKTYKVNPLGGCLPMVLQIPVFFALYRMLYEAIELRHAPFIGWINDLSAPDRLFEFGFSIPFMQAPYGIPVLTLIMGATMFLQQKMSPPPGDPAQAKMMMLMPVIFTFIFINFSSGLVLYWLVNNVLSIGQQYFVQKKYA